MSPIVSSIESIVDACAARPGRRQPGFFLGFSPQNAVAPMATLPEIPVRSHHPACLSIRPSVAPLAPLGTSGSGSQLLAFLGCSGLPGCLPRCSADAALCRGSG